MSEAKKLRYGNGANPVPFAIRIRGSTTFIVVHLVANRFFGDRQQLCRSPPIISLRWKREGEGEREKEGGLMIAIFVPFHGKISISPKIYRLLPPSRTEINERRSKSCCSPRFRDLIISQWFVPFNFLELTATFGTIAISAKKKKIYFTKIKSFRIWMFVSNEYSKYSISCCSSKYLEKYYYSCIT